LQAGAAAAFKPLLEAHLCHLRTFITRKLSGTHPVKARCL